MASDKGNGTSVAMELALLAAMSLCLRQLTIGDFLRGYRLQLRTVGLGLSSPSHPYTTYSGHHWMMTVLSK
ncbi:hypothetical protein LZ31DRAFT_552939 [Colletotrichum somersetense]|nr:hypothetical protein LZ31DRAFT_552939 [Colletotrichum somersetense]